MRDQQVAQWVAQRIPHMYGEGFGPCRAIGVISNEGQALAGVVYSEWREPFGTIQLSIASESPRWARRTIIKDLLRYPFEAVGARKVWTCIPLSNDRALKLGDGLGFTREATLKNHFGKDHGVMSRMFRGEFRRRYLTGNDNGTVQVTQSASSA